MSRDVFADIIFPANPRNELVVGMPMEDYRAAPGLSPSDIKLAVPDLGFRQKGNAARLRAHLMGETARNDSRAMDLGTLYHNIVLESSGVIVIDADKRAEMAARRKERKVAELVAHYSGKKFMANFAEAKEFKEATNRMPDPQEQETLIQARAAREADDGGLNPRSAEWAAVEQEARRIGAAVLDGDNPVHQTAAAMKKALDFAPENEDVREYLNLIDDRRRRVEVSIFCVVDVKIGQVSIPVQLKGRPDILTKGERLLDFKTAASLDIDDFSKESITRGYFLSMGCYLKMLNLLAKRVGPEVEEYYEMGRKSRAVFLCQETAAPHQTADYECPTNHLTTGWHFAKMALMDVIRRYMAEQNGERGAWKTYTDKVLNDPYYPAAISAFITEHASGGFGNAGGMARELAAQDSDKSNDITG